MSARSIIEEALADVVTMSDGREVRYDEGGVPFIWNEKEGLVLGKKGWTHFSMHRARGGDLVNCFKGRVWPKESTIAFWDEAQDVPVESLRTVAEKFQGWDFFLQFGDDRGGRPPPRTVRQWLVAQRSPRPDRMLDPEAAAASAQTKLGHAAHLLGAKASAQGASGFGASKAARAAGAEPVAQWRARQSTSESARTILEAAGELHYHVTPSRNVPRIMAQGLLPKIGPRARKLNEPPSIYLFPSVDSAEEAVMNWLGDEFSESTALALLAVKVPDDATDRPGADFERILTSPVPPAAITFLRTL